MDLLFAAVPSLRNRGLRESLLPLQPRPIIVLGVNNDVAAHLRMPDPTEASAQNLERPGSGWGKPEPCDHARHQVHFRSKFENIKIVYNVHRTQPDPDRPA